MFQPHSLTANAHCSTQSPQGPLQRPQEPSSSLGQIHYLHLQPCNPVLPLGVDHSSANRSKPTMNKFRLEFRSSFLIIRAVNIWNSLLLETEEGKSLWTSVMMMLVAVSILVRASTLTHTANSSYLPETEMVYLLLRLQIDSTAIMNYLINTLSPLKNIFSGKNFC